AFFLGASVVGDRAVEIMIYIHSIETLRINVLILSGVIHPYAAYSEVLVKIDKEVHVDNLLNKQVVMAFSKANDGENPVTAKGLLATAAIAAGSAVATMVVKNNVKPKLGVEGGRLKEVPSTPNAVSSQALDLEKYVAALPYNGSKSQAKKNLMGML